MKDERYTFKLEHADGSEITLSGSPVSLDDVIEDFKSFLLGCTFSYELVNQITRIDPNEGEHHGN